MDGAFSRAPWNSGLALWLKSYRIVHWDEHGGIAG